MEFHTDLLKYIVFAQKIPEGYGYAFNPGVFHQPWHLNLQGYPYYEFYILHEKKRKVLGHIFFHEKDGVSASPLKASYGSIEASETIDLRILWSFTEYFEEKLRADGIKKIRITLPPAIYNLNLQSKVQATFFHHGYNLIDSEVAATLISSAGNFSDNLSKHLKRRLRHCTNRNYIARIEGRENLEKIYFFIEKCRQNKNQQLSLSYSQLVKTVNTRPDKFKYFALYDGERMISASIAIQISPEILYNFYSAHDEEYNKFSPVVKLLEFMYGFCFEHGISMLDLGTSAIKGKPSFSLIHFKEHLNANLSLKLIYSKELR